MSSYTTRKSRSKTIKNGNFTLSPNDAYNNLDAPHVKSRELAAYDAELERDILEARGGLNTFLLGYFSQFRR